MSRNSVYCRHAYTQYEGLFKETKEIWLTAMALVYLQTNYSRWLQKRKKQTWKNHYFLSFNMLLQGECLVLMNQIIISTSWITSNTNAPLKSTKCSFSFSQSSFLAKFLGYKSWLLINHILNANHHAIWNSVLKMMKILKLLNNRIMNFISLFFRCRSVNLTFKNKASFAKR